MSPSNFRDHLYPHDHPRLAELRGLDARQYAEHATGEGFTGGLIEGWKALYPQEFRGVTSDGELRPGLYRREPARPGEAAPTDAMVAAAEALLGVLSPAQRERIAFAADAPEWQSWANPEFIQHDTGLRLEEVEPAVRERLFGLLEASLSPAGAALARDLMYINGYLGDIVELSDIMNELSYNFALYGTPSRTEPWGWQLFGHHCALNCLVVGEQMVVSPIFFGAEPSVVDDGPRAGLQVFADRIRPARELMAAMSPEHRAFAVTYAELVDPAMPEGRVHPGDERHLAGAFQDNRVIPSEGILATELPEAQQQLVGAIIDTFVAHLPEGPRRARRREIQEHWAETWFSWIGGWEGEEAFYYRVQSPVLIAELDHHCGVFLSNEEPADFHIHTVLRTPNGNDYGRALVTGASA